MSTLQLLEAELGPDPDLTAAMTREALGDHPGAIRALSAVRGGAHQGAIDTELVALRHRGAVAMEGAVGRSEWPPELPDPHRSAHDTAPEVNRSDLDAAVLGGSIVNRGCLIVRGLFDSDRAGGLRDGLDRAVEEAFGRSVDDGGGRRWYQPFDPPGASREKLREWATSAGSAWLPDSPALLRDTLEALEECGVHEHIAGYLGEQPVMSLEKSTLRRIPPDIAGTTWHQDGAFIQRGSRTVNVWVALNECGGTSPASGLEILPRRFREIHKPSRPIAGDTVGENDRKVPLALDDDTVAALYAGGSPVLPHFLAGDALLFDEWLPHRTATGSGLTESRYALELWHFAPSAMPSAYTPLLC